ncbi:unnamed protein product [Bemisia tabaci]|uniref:Translocon-associated protein subunit delta n=1 Tax=Bemisia tabaci TaxID=7038 RepID=A0A9P0AMM8_BEMTA|nr:PREDICTED: translocon-associated protein subunit delta [Bemisia tabaci]CAH0395072.1 unnamed protein product [Bemisia tabaci]
MISQAVFVFLSLVALSSAESCVSPEVSASSYYTQDGIVLTHVGFIIEFSLKCANNVKDLALVAEVDGKLLPEAKVTGNDRYQVSWVEDIKKFRSGERFVNLFDEEGAVALRKALRNGDDISSIKPLVTIAVSHPGTYQGPWVNSEFLATSLAIGVWYAAYSLKSKLLAQ